MTASLGRLWAVARMTLLEALRRRVFLILLLFGAALLSATLFFPAVDPLGRLRLLQAWSLRAAYLFTAVVALFLAGFSLPSDFEQKRIYVLVSKPLSKPFVFLGRLLGFSLLLAIFVGAMALLSLAFMRTVALFAGPAAPPLAAYPRVLPREFHYRGGLMEERDAMGYALRDGALLWRFDGLSRADFADDIRAQVRLYVGSPDDLYRVEGQVAVSLRTGSGRETSLPPLTLHSNEEREFTIPVSALDGGGDGRLDVMFRPMDADGVIAGHKGRLFLFKPSMLFEAAYLRGMGLVWLQSLIVLATTLAASTFVSAPLSIILGIFVYLVGVTHSYVSEGTRDIERALGEATTTGKTTGVVKDVGRPLSKAAAVVAKATLWMVPDFQHFDYSRWLLKDLSVSGAEAGTAALRALVPFAALTLLGIAVMRFKDFG